MTTAAPNIHRVMPEQDAIFRTDSPLEVYAAIRWANDQGQWGHPCEFPARAIAWSYQPAPCVLVSWTYDGEVREDWLDAADIRRR